MVLTAADISEFFFRKDSIFLIECKTVVWCLPPSSLPICGRDFGVSSLQIYMAICLGTAIAGELFFALSCAGLIEKKEATARIIISVDNVWVSSI